MYKNDEKYVRDQTTGLIWHRTVHRTLYADTDRSQVVYHPIICATLSSAAPR